MFAFIILNSNFMVPHSQVLRIVSTQYVTNWYNCMSIKIVGLSQKWKKFWPISWWKKLIKDLKISYMNKEKILICGFLYCVWLKPRVKNIIHNPMVIHTQWKQKFIKQCFFLYSGMPSDIFNIFKMLIKWLKIHTSSVFKKNSYSMHIQRIG